MMSPLRDDDSGHAMRGTMRHGARGGRRGMTSAKRQANEGGCRPRVLLPAALSLIPMPALAQDAPATRVSLEELENDHVFRLLEPEAVQRRTAAWTRVKAS